jgi:cyclophilin family peptidyl-prolyl cis-trans isomerase
MSRIGLGLLLLGLAPLVVHAQDATQPAAETPAAPAADAPATTEPQPPGPSAEAVAARQAFDALREQWATTTQRLASLQLERQKAQGDARAALDQQVAEARNEAEAILAKILDAGVAVYKADPNAYPDVNNTLMFVAEFYLAGDANGDGGDQYEKALSLIKSLIDAGAGEKWPQLYLWGAIAASATSDYDLAEQYFAKSSAAGGADGGLPPRLLEQVEQYRQTLPTMRKAWEKEQAIRAAEAKADDLPRVKLSTTKGDIVIELFENEAPQSVANFLSLVKKGFYDGVTFHRVIPGFMAQGGDPEGTGAGGPGYTIRDEHRQPNYRHHFRGTLSMAKTQAPNSGGSQFFLTFVPTTHLDGAHTAFGRVI